MTQRLYALRFTLYAVRLNEAAKWAGGVQALRGWTALVFNFGHFALWLTLGTSVGFAALGIVYL